MLEASLDETNECILIGQSFVEAFVLRDAYEDRKTSAPSFVFRFEDFDTIISVDGNGRLTLKRVAGDAKDTLATERDNGRQLMYWERAADIQACIGEAVVRIKRPSGSQNVFSFVFNDCLLRLDPEGDPAIRITER